MFSQAVGWEDASTVEAKYKAQVAKCKEEASKFKEEADAACSLLAGVRGELAGVRGELAEAQRALDSAGAREAKLMQQTRDLQEQLEIKAHVSQVMQVEEMSKET